jgi:putative Holliday junction resolvase
MAIDFGSRKVGIALSDAKREFAFPHIVVKREDALEAVQKIVKSHEVVAVVIGESKDLSGKDNPIQKSIISFAEAVEKKTELPIYFEPEHFSSKEASRETGENDMIDASAAAVLLRSFIEKKRYKETQ